MKKLFFLILSLPLFLAACKSSSGFKTCWANDWTLCYSKNVQLESKNPPSFVMQGKAEPHYLLRKQTDISSAQEVVVRYRVDIQEGIPYIRATDCKTKQPGQIAVFFQRAGDDMFAKGDKQYYRWWSRNRPNITPGDHEIKVSLDPVKNQWISVWGKGTLGNEKFFNAAKKNVRQIGVTFGGCGGAGHGINIEDGIAKITVLSIEVK